MFERFQKIKRFQKKGAKSKSVLSIIILALVLFGTSACTSPDAHDSTDSNEEMATQEFTDAQAKKREKALLAKEDEIEKLAEEQRDEPADLPKQEAPQEINDQLKVHYINVGQGDSTLIELPNGQTVLIDGATRRNGQTVIEYLEDLKIDTVDYLIATHPHEDHIGGLVNVVKEFEIGQIYMPDKAHTTIVFEDLLLAIKEKGYSITKAQPGDVLFDEEGLSMNIIAPFGITGENLNNYSISNRLVFGNTAFLFTGDAEGKSEKNMVESDFILEADVLKVGHHGGDTSSINSFLSAVNPDYGVISAGVDNQYGHPHANVMNRLADHGIQSFRTDQEGTIIASSDGETIEFNQEETPIKETPPRSDVADSDAHTDVYRTDTGSKYHRGDCHTLEHSKVALPLNEAKEEGLEPCGICKPPE